MNDLQYSIENFHKPRMAKLAEFLLTEAEFPYDYYEPPSFETYMIQIKLSDEFRISINYFPIEISDQAPYLFLQFHCVVSELDDEPSADLLRYIAWLNTRTELSDYNVDEGRLYMKSVLIDDPEAELDLNKIGFILRIFYRNLVDHLEGIRRVLAGGSIADEISS